MFWLSSGSSSNFKKSYDSVRRKVLYNSLIEFGIPKNLVKASKNVSERNQ